MPKINIPDYLKNLTKSPGVYKFLDKSGNVIYVGKAKNLRNRVRSYFNTKHSDEKTKSLVSNICLLYTSPSPRDLLGSRMPSSA